VPLLNVESSIALSAEQRKEVLGAIGNCVVRNMEVALRQVRARISYVDPSTAQVGEGLADDEHPWVVAWVSILEGRTEARRTGFIDDLAGVLATAFRVDESHVRVVIQEVPKVHWGIGRQTAAALGR
jgi:4-oxalocrotonate tautomerase